jgi:hypothetical protein
MFKVCFDIVFSITKNADTIYNIRNRNEMTDRNRKLSRNTANLLNRKEIDNNRKGVRAFLVIEKTMSKQTLNPKSL